METARQKENDVRRIREFQKIRKSLRELEKDIGGYFPNLLPTLRKSGDRTDSRPGKSGTLVTVSKGRKKRGVLTAGKSREEMVRINRDRANVMKGEKKRSDSLDSQKETGGEGWSRSKREKKKKASLPL